MPQRPIAAPAFCCDADDLLDDQRAGDVAPAGRPGGSRRRPVLLIAFFLQCQLLRGATFGTVPR